MYKNLFKKLDIIAMGTINGTSFDHVPEKIFQIGQVVQKLWTYFKLQISITQ